MSSTTQEPTLKDTVENTALSPRNEPADPVLRPPTGVETVRPIGQYIDPQSPLWSVAAKSIVAISVLVLGALVVWRFQDLIRPIVIAAILAYLVSPLVSWLMHRLHIGRGGAVVVIYLALLVIFLVSLAALGFVAFEQLARLTRLLPDSLTEMIDLAQRQLDALLVRFSGLMRYDVRTLQQAIDLRSVAQQAITLLQSTLRRGGSLAALLAQTTVNALADGIFIFFISLYIAKDGPQFFRAISDAAHDSGYRRDAERLMRDFVRIWDAYLRGQVILGLVIGTAVTLGLSALGVSTALGLGILSGLLEFLPIIGPLIGTVAAVAVALFQPENYLGLSPLYHALAVLVLMIVIQQVENNLLVPRIVGEALDLHPIIVMVGVLMGTSLAGILGAVLAAPVVASIKLLGTYTWRKMLDLPPFPQAELPTRPKRGQMGWSARWRLLRMQAGRLRSRCSR